jgi:hypothetical protein
MLLPALSKAREKGKAAACMNNQKNLHLAMSYYCDDYSGYLPVGSTVCPQGSWCFQLSDYLNINWQASSTEPESGPLVFWCPSSLDQISSGAYAKTWAYPKLWLLSYGYNGYFYSTSAPYSSYRQKLAMVKNPSQVLLLDDFQYPAETNQPVPIYCRVNNGMFRYDLDQTTIAWRHSGMDNVLLADGHSKAVKYTASGLSAYEYILHE